MPHGAHAQCPRFMPHPGPCMHSTVPAMAARSSLKVGDATEKVPHLARGVDVLRRTVAAVKAACSFNTSRAPECGHCY